jgi:hypothetical protein
MKIELYQSLYERYSNLNLSFEEDRPVAIKGLEARLIRTFDTTGGFGIFDRYLHRCLLWQRSGDCLRRIVSFRKGKIPSWSWMAYNGGIRYLDVPFGEVVWSEDIISPYSETGLKNWRDVDDGAMAPWIIAPAWDVIEPQNRHMILDEPSRTFTRPLKCVTVGKNRTPQLDGRRIHYVLVISFVSSADEFEVYERIGVGFVEEQYIMLSGLGISVNIQ